MIEDYVYTPITVGDAEIFANNNKAAQQITEYLSNENALTILVAEMQSGKTSSMIGCHYHMKSLYDRKGKSLEVSYLNCISDSSQQDQIKSRLVEAKFKGETEKNDAGEVRNYHVDTFDKFRDRISQSQCANLIFIDEIHQDFSKENKQELYKSFLIIKEVKEKNNIDIYICVASATPYALTIISNQCEDIDLKIKWVYLEPGENFKGVQYNLENGRYIQHENNFEGDKVTGWCKATYLKSFLTYYEKKKHCGISIYRNQDGLDSNQKANLRKEFRATFKNFPNINLAFVNSDTVSKNKKAVHWEPTTFIEILSKENAVEIKKPENEHNIRLDDTFYIVLIKQILKAGITIENKDVIVNTYDTPVKNQNDDTIQQGLAGRASGYDISNDYDIFTNVESMNLYYRYIKAASNHDYDGMFLEVGTGKNNFAMKTKKSYEICEYEKASKKIVKFQCIAPAGKKAPDQIRIDIENYLKSLGNEVSPDAGITQTGSLGSQGKTTGLDGFFNAFFDKDGCLKQKYGKTSGTNIAVYFNGINHFPNELFKKTKFSYKELYERLLTEHPDWSNEYIIRRPTGQKIEKTKNPKLKDNSNTEKDVPNTSRSTKVEVSEAIFLNNADSIKLAI